MTRVRAVGSIVFVLVACAGIALAIHVFGKKGEVLRIGAVLSAPPSSFGTQSEAVRQGFELAKQDLEREWNGEASLDLVLLDSGGSASTAVEKVNELHKRGIDLLAEIVGDELLETCAGPIRNNKMVLVSPTATGSTRSLGPTVFRARPPMDDAVRELARMGPEVGIKKPLVIYQDDVTGREWKSSFAFAWGGMGDGVMLPLVEGQTASQRIGDQIAVRAPDGVFLLVAPRDAGAIVKEVRARGLKTLVLGTETLAQPETAEVAGKAALSKALVVTRAEHQAPARRAAVEAAWKAKYGASTPDERVFAAYDSLQILARAARTGHGEAERTAAYLRTLDFDGATGRVAFEGTGDRRAPQLVRRVLTESGALIPFTNDLVRQGG